MAKNWEDVVNEQAIAFAHLCAQNPRVSALADKHDNGPGLTGAEEEEFFALSMGIMENPFFARRCLKDWEEFED